MSWSELTEDVLLMICEKVTLKDIAQISLVCKCWYRILSRQKILWKKVLVKYLEEKNGSKVVKSGLNRLRELNNSVNWKEECIRIASKSRLPLIKGQVLLNRNQYDPQRFCISNDGLKIAIVDEDLFLRIYKRESENDPYIQVIKKKVVNFDWDNHMEFSPTSKKLIIMNDLAKCDGEFDFELKLEITFYNTDSESDSAGSVIQCYELTYDYYQRYTTNKASHHVAWMTDNAVTGCYHNQNKLVVWTSYAEIDCQKYASQIRLSTREDGSVGKSCDLPICKSCNPSNDSSVPCEIWRQDILDWNEDMRIDEEWNEDPGGFVENPWCCIVYRASNKTLGAHRAVNSENLIDETLTTIASNAEEIFCSSYSKQLLPHKKN